MEKLYLVKLFKHDKLLFGIVALYLLGILYGVARSREQFPFLLYGMYSLKEEPKASYTTYDIQIAGQQVDYDHLWDSQGEMIKAPLLHYASLTAGRDSISNGQFMRWLFSYAADMRLIEQNTMQVYRLTASYNANGIPSVTNRELIFSYDVR